MASQPIIQDDQIAKLAPSLFTSRGWSEAVDQDVRENFLRLYKPLRDKGMEEYHLARIATALYYYRPLLADLLKPTQTKTVLEIGSGLGAKALSWANLFQSYVGIELLPEDAAKSTEVLREFGVSNARIICGNADAILGEPEKYGIERIDLLVLYAVLEHLTIPERKLILRLAQKIYLQGGHVMIAESPNRLCRFDQHTWQLGFTDWLPLDLMAEYAVKSTREDLKWKLNSTPLGQSPEGLYRLGRGISFHEFECFWEKETFEFLGILNDGYSTELLNYYPFLRDEWDLLRFCTDNKIKTHRLFTRYWIEGIFSQNVIGPDDAVRYLTPQEIATPQSRRRFWQRTPRVLPPPPVLERRLFWELDEITLAAGGSVLINAETPAKGPHDAVLLIDSARSSGRLVVEETKSGARSVIDLAKILAGRLPLWHTRVALPLGSSLGGVYRVQVEGNGSTLSCQGALLV